MAIEKSTTRLQSVLGVTEDDIVRDHVTPPPPDAMHISDEEMARARLHPRCIVENYRFADVAQLIAPGGTGKTTLLLYESVCIALGRPLWGLKVVNPGWSLFITAEDARERLVARLREIIEVVGLEPWAANIVKRNVRIWDVTGRHLPLARMQGGGVVLTTLADEIVQAYKDDPPAISNFDPMVSFGASEAAINDNEQAIVTAMRRIVRGLDCCVRVIHHTGKQSARDETLDQYAGRGGRAIADGARMTTVLQAWTPNDSARTPPRDMTIDTDSSVTILARPKISYAPPGLPNIWIKRAGFRFEHVTEAALPPGQEDAARAEELHEFLECELLADRRYARKHLESALKSADGLKSFRSRDELRRSVDFLMVRGRLVDAPLPKELRRGAHKTYLHPVNLADEFGEIGEKTTKNSDHLADENTCFSISRPYREEKNGEIAPSSSPPAPSHLAEKKPRDTARLARYDTAEAKKHRFKWRDLMAEDG